MASCSGRGTGCSSTCMMREGKMIGFPSCGMDARGGDEKQQKGKNPARTERGEENDRCLRGNAYLSSWTSSATAETCPKRSPGEKGFFFALSCRSGGRLEATLFADCVRRRLLPSRVKYSGQTPSHVPKSKKGTLTFCVKKNTTLDFICPLKFELKKPHFL